MAHVPIFPFSTSKIHAKTTKMQKKAYGPKSKILFQKKSCKKKAYGPYDMGGILFLSHKINEIYYNLLKIFKTAHPEKMRFELLTVDKQVLL